MRRLECAAAMVNPFLVVIAIGLATITVISFSVLAIKDALPPITRISCPVPTSASQGAAQSVTTKVSSRKVITSAFDSAISDRPVGNL